MMMTKFLILVYSIVAATALILVKIGSNDGGLIQTINDKSRLVITPTLLSGMFLYGVSFLIYIFLVSRFDLGYIIPLTTAMVYIVVFISSAVFLKENYTAFKIAGICLIVIGVLLINFKN